MRKEKEYYITKRMKQYQEKHDFINKTLLDSSTYNRNDQD